MQGAGEYSLLFGQWVFSPGMLNVIFAWLNIAVCLQFSNLDFSLIAFERLAAFAFSCGRNDIWIHVSHIDLTSEVVVSKAPYLDVFTANATLRPTLL